MTILVAKLGVFLSSSFSALNLNLETHQEKGQRLAPNMLELTCQLTKDTQHTELDGTVIIHERALKTMR